MDNFTARFNDSLKSSNLKGAKHILANLPGEPDRVCREVFQRLVLVPEDTAWELLMFLSEISFRTPDIRGRLFKVIQNRAELNFQFLPILYRAGTQKIIQESTPLMKQVLSNEIDTGILMETIRAVGKYKITALVDEISEYIYFDNEELKTHTIQALERIGTPRALRLLENAATTVKCDPSILDAISILKSSPDLVQKVAPPRNKDCNKADICRELESTDLETRFNAFTRLQVLDGESIHWLKQNLLSTNHDLVINTIEIIGTTISTTMVPPLYRLLADKTIPNTIRFAAYEALGAFPEFIEPAPFLLDDMDAPALHLRMAAINLLDKTPTDLVLSEIKNRIETGRKKGEMLAETILDIKAGNIIESLMVSDTFAYIASNYLLKQAAISPLQGYIDILMGRGLTATASKFSLTLERRLKENRPTALVLGRSKTVLAVYEKLLYRKGYAPLLFLSCQDALKSIAEAAPELIVSDLFLNGTTFVEFALQIQKHYLPRELTFVISTLQQAFMGNKLGSLCAGIGVQEIFEFPAGPKHIPSPW
ncbi:two-component response receiver and regulator protein [Desulforapulum autotrophicum HRM2]|uniref:Two-component response receiver and regulator protein n=1 Tax=Desulforapulum autotrophicum (strain ATCC 43914 / DSM 3382 / VKM B-1955 / HRM2) TaxID=177437 RepID=C0QI46_DESAH|nr:HEAT repeat domain-containing protein [Desulforapulum autotrophicum]ACN15782.1 two-component response receiver and regulator protein [Desulforapulum autotrophicum HRM2]